MTCSGIVELMKMDEKSCITCKHYDAEKGVCQHPEYGIILSHFFRFQTQMCVLGG